MTESQVTWTEFVLEFQSNNCLTQSYLCHHNYWENVSHDKGSRPHLKLSVNHSRLINSRDRSAALCSAAVSWNWCWWIMSWCGHLAPLSFIWGIHVNEMSHGAKFKTNTDVDTSLIILKIKLIQVKMSIHLSSTVCKIVFRGGDNKNMIPLLNRKGKEWFKVYTVWKCFRSDSNKLWWT